MSKTTVFRVSDYSGGGKIKTKRHEKIEADTNDGIRKRNIYIYMHPKKTDKSNRVLLPKYRNRIENRMQSTASRKVTC